jgi:ATP-binding cassette subfamily C (CFTR/MRP) protein 4
MFMTNHHVYFFTWKQGMQYRIATIAAIYDKTLRLNSTSSSYNSGTMTNLASNDVDRFLTAAAFGPYLIWGPILMLVIPVVGSFVISWSFAVGIAFLVFVIVPVQLKWSKKLGRMRSKTAQYTDERMAHVSQALTGIRVAKMMGWEENFEQRITSCRKNEVDWIKGANRYRVSSHLYSMCARQHFNEHSLT